MKGNISIIFALSVLTLISSCKKNSPADPDDPNLLIDGDMSPQLGKKINLAKYDPYGNYIWGRNSDELFIGTFTNGTLKLQPSSNTVKPIENQRGKMVVKTNENSAIIFADAFASLNGVYSYSFSDNVIDRILSLSVQLRQISIAENHMMLLWTPVPPSFPCTFPLDFWCSNPSSAISSNFLYIDKITKQAVPLDNKGFICFSRDSRNTLLSGTNNNQMLYTFSNSQKSITDSIDLSQINSLPFSRTFFYDNMIKIAEVETGTGLKDRIVIRNAVTGQIMDSLTSTAKFLADAINWSEDGTKLFYTGGAGLNSNIMIINVYDLITRQEKTVATFSLLAGGANPVSAPGVRLSPDNKKIVLRYITDLYIKDI